MYIDNYGNEYECEEDYLRILKTSPKNFVWELIDKIDTIRIYQEKLW